MNKEAQRIKIAEACGWIFRDDGLQNISPSGGKWSTVNDNFEGVPDYLADLNACHEMEKVLNWQQRNEYVKRLWAMPPGFVHPNEVVHFVHIHATAAQRCEAFLHTLNLWQDEP